MIVINSQDESRFTLNGIEYFRNYINEVAGDSIRIYNCFTAFDIRVDFTHFSEFIIDGTTYGSVILTQQALNNVTFNKFTGDGGGGIPDAPNNANAYVRSALSWVVGYTKTAVDALLGNKVDANAPITGTVKTKITYDSKGLVTSGSDALTSDIADSLNRRYVTDAQLVVIGNTSGTNTGDNATNSQYSGLATSKQDVLTDVNFGTFSTALTPKTTPVDADSIPLSDSEDSNKAKKLSFANLKAWILSFVPTVITPETGIYYFNDFLGVFTTSTNDGNISSDGNVGSSNSPNSDANKQGFGNANTSTATAGYGNIYIGHNATLLIDFILGGGVTIYETLIWLPNLSTSGERFSCLIGFSSGFINQNNSANNIAFLYDEGNIAFAGSGGASANWRAVTTDSATRTFTDTGVAVNAGAFIKLKIVVNANASSVGFYIDNTLVATHTTNIPSGNTKRLNVRNYIQKSVGYTQRQLILDYVKLQQTFTTAR